MAVAWCRDFACGGSSTPGYVCSQTCGIALFSHELVGETDSDVAEAKARFVEQFKMVPRGNILPHSRNVLLGWTA